MKSSPIGFPKPVKQNLSGYEKAQASWERAKNKRTMPVVKRKAKKRVKLPSIRSLVLKADKVFSIFIRQRDLRCVLCGSSTQLTNGHLIKRGKKRVRWSEVNCNCLCSGCNYRDNFNHDLYVSWFIKKYGHGTYLELVESSKYIFKPSRELLMSIIEKYK